LFVFGQNKNTLTNIDINTKWG